jgi:methyl-accepting chemotaxis protein
VSGISRSRSTYATKFAVSTVVLVGVVAAACVNLYTNLAPELSAEQRATLLSGIATIVVVLVVGLVFIAAAVGREALSALRVLAERARELEEGDYDVDLETNRNDEFGEVYRALAEMRSGVESRDEQVDRAETKTQQVERYANEWAARIDAAASGDLSQRLDEDVNDRDLATLAESFNRLMDRLETNR